MGQLIELKGTYLNVVNFAMQQNRVPVICDMQLQNLTRDTLENISVRVETKPQFASPLVFNIDRIGPMETLQLDFEKLNLHLDATYLMSLTERFAGQLHISASVGDVVDFRDIHEIDVLAYNEWSGTAVMPQLLSSFVTPNHPLVSRVLRRAAEKLKEWYGDSAITGYLKQSENSVLQQMAAIFAALQEQNIAYCVPPAGFETTGQKLRLCDDIDSQKLGTCLDLSLLYAACLEQAGLNPLIICIQGHAFAGCWLIPETFPSSCQDDFSMLSKRFDASVGEIAVVECTQFAGNTQVSFDNAKDAAENHFLEPEKFHFFIDVKQSRLEGILPVPQRNYDSQGNIVKPVTELDGTSWQAAREIRVVEKENLEGPVKHSKQRIWQNKLLNLSVRNSLLNFRPAGSVLQLICNDLGTLEDALSDGEEFKIAPFFDNVEKDSREDSFISIKKDRENDELLKGEFENRRLRTFLGEAETERRIVSLYRSAKTSLEENGSNTLYLALGFLRWYESDISEKPRYAPLVMIPLEIVRKSARQGYIIRARDEETQFNITLLEKLRGEFNIRIAGLDPMPTDDSGVDLKKIFAKVRNAVMDKKRWDVVEYAFIGQFSFSQYIMWNDIGTRAKELEENSIVKGLVEGSIQSELPALVSATELDAQFKPSDMAIPMNTDSSQLAAICSAAKGCSFVLPGPPGTGKSQTITNIISNALFNGKSVLFIAEKMAALSVVQKRLEKVGLGPFCLELHSNKSSKTAITAQLEKALNFTRRKSPEEYGSEARKLHELRQSLNATMEKIHKVHPSGYSLYSAICEYEKYRDAEGKLKIPADITASADADAIKRWLDSCEKLRVAAQCCGDIPHHPLADWRSSQYSEGGRNQLDSLLEELLVNLEDLEKKERQIQERLYGLTLHSDEKMQQFQRLAKNLDGPDEIPLNLLTGVSSQTAANLREACDAGVQYSSLREKILTNFEPEILDADALSLKASWKEAETKWFLPRFFATNKILKQVQIYAKDVKSVQKNQLPQLFGDLVELGRSKQALTEKGQVLSNLYGEFWQDYKSDWDLLKNQHKAAAELQKCTAGLYDNSQAHSSLNQALSSLKKFREYHKSLFDGFENALVTLKNNWEKLTQITSLQGGFPAIEQSFISKTREKIRQWKNALPRWREWCSYHTYRKEMNSYGLNCIAKAVESGSIELDFLMAAFRNSIAYNLCVQYIDEDGSLGCVTGALLQLEIDRYKDSNDKFEALTRKELVAKLSANIPSSTFASDTTEVGILKRNIANKCRGTSIRKLFDSIPNLLRRLTPCMLMSPISVAQYIDPSAPKFDLVIFDEASQLPTCEAVGAIARGKSLVVVGDPKQMPPTSFFKKGFSDEDNIEKEDLESILDDCLAISMPETHLLWHYRSKDESLIAFSNYKYYNHELFTFPSPNDLAGAVKFIPVQGVYDKSKTRQNKAEAEAIVKEIVSRLSNPETRRQSIGIVTFSVVQQTLIEDMLEKEFAKNPALEDYARESGEPIFVKNLESVQGDERDVIMFSIGYGPDVNGNVSMNFGPINNAGGWRRLNVAVTRSRIEMLVFSTLQPEQIDLNRTSSEGVAGLKAFLTFAKLGKNSLAKQEANKNEINAGQDDFKKSVARELQKQGFRVETDVGCSKYKLDIAIVHPEKPTEYILGILCDGQTYKNSATARDRNISQQGVLEALGWNIMRLWSIEWFLNRENRPSVIASVKNTIENLLEKEKTAGNTPQKSVPENPAAPLPEEEDALLPEISMESFFPVYETAKLETPKGADFYDESRTNILQSQLKSILEKESPISEDSLYTRFADAWDMKKTAKFQDRVQSILSAENFLRAREGDKVFVWKQRRETLVDFRRPSADFKRNLEDISEREIASAIVTIVNEQMSIDIADLERIVAKIAGYSKCTAQMKESIDGAVHYAVKNSLAVLNDTRVSKPS
ncbi:MAG: DUF3320 domain-containing protein [Fibrobacter sp.]|nr:DUF3320 domain-containing protein [Fibrobacter sp.]